MTAQRACFLAFLVLAGCGEPTARNEGAEGSTTPPYVRAESDQSLLANTVQAVTIGEPGPNFAACTARGAVRERARTGPVPVRAAPYEESDQIATLAADSEFFICSRTNDQHWFGIVYDEGGEASDRCGVSAPIPARRIYQGPCAAGWVPSASVRLISGVAPHLPATGEPSADPPNG